MLPPVITGALDTYPDLCVVDTVDAPLGDIDSAQESGVDVVIVALENNAPSVAAAYCSGGGPRVIIVAQTFNEADCFAGLLAGAVGYLTADVHIDDLVSVIRRAHAGEMLYTAEQLFRLLRHQARIKPLISTDAKSLGVSARECEVLRALAEGLSTAEVALRLHISTHTVITHLKNVTSKLHARSRLDAIVIALRLGLIELPTHD